MSQDARVSQSSYTHIQYITTTTLYNFRQHTWLFARIKQQRLRLRRQVTGRVSSVRFLLWSGPGPSSTQSPPGRRFCSRSSGLCGGLRLCGPGDVGPCV